MSDCRCNVVPAVRCPTHDRPEGDTIYRRWDIAATWRLLELLMWAIMIGGTAAGLLFLYLVVNQGG